MSGVRPWPDSCATISAATVPWPTMVLNESNGSIIRAPVVCASARAAEAASSKLSPVTMISTASRPW